MPEIKEQTSEKTKESFFEELKNNFINNSGKEAWESIQGIATDTIKDLAKAKFYSLLGSEADKKLAQASVVMISDSLKDLRDSATDQAVNYALERLESFVSKIVFREILRILV